MDRAKENYMVGKQRLVEAEEIENEYYQTISSKERRFICPSCGEYMAYVRRTRYKSYFRHGNKNDTTIECEKRSEVELNCSIYEKIGPQLYLKKISKDKYELCVGMYGVPAWILKKCQNNNYSITISDCINEEYVKYNINNTRFTENKISYMEILFVSNKYKLDYSSDVVKKLLEKYWGTGVEGFLNNAMLFEFSGNIKKRIRVNDEITTDTDYYLVCDKYINIPVYILSDRTVLGVLNMKSNYCSKFMNVYRINFRNISESQFIKIHNYCRDMFKVSLVYKPSKLELIWPPALECDNQISFLKHIKSSMFLMYSEEVESRVFVHYMNECSIKKGNKVDNYKSLFEINTRDQNLAININEKYNSINFIVSSYEEKGIKDSKVQEYFIYDSKNNEIQLGIIDKIPCGNKIIVKSISKCVILHLRDNLFYKQYDIKSEFGIVINNIQCGDEILALQGFVEVPLIEIQKVVENKEKVDGEKLFEILSQNKLSRSVKSPVWLKELAVMYDEESRIYKLIRNYICSHTIPISSLKILLQIKFRRNSI